MRSFVKTMFQGLFLNKTGIALLFSFGIIGASLFFSGFLGISGQHTLLAANSNNNGGIGDGDGGDSIDAGDVEVIGDGDSGTIDPLCGFAWGATNEATPTNPGVGWISFNSKDCDTDGNGTISAAEAANRPGCPAGVAGSYGVNVDSSRNLSGYAWSSNLGWLKFGNLSSMPNTAGNNQQDARIDSNNNSDNNLSGWARFCAGTASGDCSSMTSRTDGWDGWVSLRGNGSSSGSYGVTYNGSSNRFSGYSWGGTVVGWLNWNPSSGNGVRYCTIPTVSVSLSAVPSTGEAPLSSVLTATPSPSTDPSDRYRFTCDRLNTALSAAQTSPIFNCNSYYTQAGTTYYPLVELTRGSLQATSTATIVTNPGDPIPDPLDVSCTAIPKPVAVNLPVTWTAIVNNPTNPLPVAGYTYDFVFYKNNGQTLDNETPGQPNRLTISGPAEVNEAGVVVKHVERTYSTLGNKTAVVRVTDNDTGAQGQCPSTDTSVTVNASIIEI